MNSKTLSLKTTIKELDLQEVTLIIQWNIRKKYIQLFATILTESHLKRKNTKSVKLSKVITQQPKTFENSNIVDIKSIIIEHPITS